MHIKGRITGIFHLELDCSFQMSELSVFFCLGECMSPSSSLNCFKPANPVPAVLTTLLSPAGMCIRVVFYYSTKLPSKQMKPQSDNLLNLLL